MADIEKALPAAEHLFSQLNEDGLIEIIDELTGDVVAIQSSTDDLLKGKRERLVEYTLEDGTIVLIEKGMSLDRISKKSYAYSKVLADIICQEVTEGAPLTKLCKEDKYPSYATVCRWRRDHDDFNKALVMAYKFRADYYADKVLEEAEDTLTKDDAAVQKVKVDALKWSAEKGNPERYGNKVKLLGDAAPIHLMIDTGIDRSPEGLKDVTPEDSMEELQGAVDAKAHEQNDKKTETKTEKEVDGTTHSDTSDTDSSVSDSSGSSV
jgi:hypothetical protein